MGRGPRTIALLALAFALGGQSPEAGTKANQPETRQQKPQPAQPISAHSKSIEAVQPLDYYRPCEYRGKDRNSDLCAQWTAAKGATDAAYWAKWSFWIGLIGFLGLLGTLYYTRKAVLAAEESTRDADRAIQIARRNADASAAAVKQMRENSLVELRPWLTFESFTPTEISDDTGQHIGIGFVFHFINPGRIPAVKVNVLNKGQIARANEEIPIFKVSSATKRTFSGIVGPGLAISSTMVALDLAAYRELREGDSKLFVHHLVTYSDPRVPKSRFETETVALLTFAHDESMPDGKRMPRFQIMHVGDQNRLT